jgi:hypothetical protein
MFEFGGVLRTWAVTSEPAPNTMLESDELPDHRLAYLDYEGTITGDRGIVSRWDSGTFEVVREAEGELRFVLQGRQLHGVAHFRRDPSLDQRWNITFSPGKSEPER